jgi:hypothetical protein
MLSIVLGSERAVQVNIAIMRAFVQMRELAASNRVLARRLDELEKKFAGHDRQFVAVFDAIRQMMQPADKGRKSIGFQVEEDTKASWSFSEGGKMTLAKQEKEGKRRILSAAGTQIPAQTGVHRREDPPRCHPRPAASDTGQFSAGDRARRGSL